MRISLSNGGYTTVDAKHFDNLSKYRWYKNKNGYACRRSSRGGVVKTVWIHREVKGNPNKHFKIDHINGEKLDNRLSNLRLCTQQQNSCNRKIGKNNTSGYKGVYRRFDDKKWVASITYKGKILYLGSFEDITEAVNRYNSKALELHGEFALVNKL